MAWHDLLSAFGSVASLISLTDTFAERFAGNGGEEGRRPPYAPLTYPREMVQKAEQEGAAKAAEVDAQALPSLPNPVVEALTRRLNEAFHRAAQETDRAGYDTMKFRIISRQAMFDWCEIAKAIVDLTGEVPSFMRAEWQIYGCGTSSEGD